MCCPPPRPRVPGPRCSSPLERITKTQPGPSVHRVPISVPAPRRPPRCRLRGGAGSRRSAPSGAGCPGNTQLPALWTHARRQPQRPARTLLPISLGSRLPHTRPRGQRPESAETPAPAGAPPRTPAAEPVLGPDPSPRAVRLSIRPSAEEGKAPAAAPCEPQHRTSVWPEMSPEKAFDRATKLTSECCK